MNQSISVFIANYQAMLVSESDDPVDPQARVLGRGEEPHFH
jgi:hypothetical protein